MGNLSASLPCPADNAGDAFGDNPPGAVYTKYQWALYHAENPFFGHFGLDAASGRLLGIWLTPLGGVTNTTSAATNATIASTEIVNPISAVVMNMAIIIASTL